jgi:ATP-binding cassette subfamily B protein
MERQAFARALRFLDYQPAAKWTALFASVGTSILFVALLGTLALFVDLTVNQGEVPAFSQLPRRTQRHYLAKQSTVAEGLPPAGLKDVLQRRLGRIVNDEATDGGAIVFGEDQLERIAGDESLRHSLLWLTDLPNLAEANAGPEAAELVRAELRRQLLLQGLDRALVMPLEDFGLLGSVLRTQGSVEAWLAAPLARWDPWTWRYGNHYYLQGLCLFAFGLALTRFGLSFASKYMAARATLEAVTRLRRAVYHHTHRLGSLAVRALGPSEAVSVSTRHLEAVHDGLFLWLAIHFREPAKFILLLAFAMLIHFWLALAFVLFAFLVWAIGGQVAAHVRREGRRDEQRAADYMTLIQESLMLMRLVKVYLMELFNQARVERQLAGYARAQLRRYRGEAFYRPLFAFLGLAAAIVLLLLAGTAVLDGQLGVSAALNLSAALVCLYWPLVKWLEARRTIRRSRQSAKVLFDFLDRPGSVGQAVEAEFLPPLNRALEFDNVRLHEPGTGRKLLRGVTLTIPAGKKVALIGADDTEKHALAYLIPRFLDPREGEVRIDGKNLRWVTLDSLRIQTAMVLQHNLVFSDTVANNIGCGDPTYSVQRIIAAAKIAHAHQFILKLPHGYDTMIGDLGHSLSPGEAFRIALARAILREPALLIIEEPAAALDDDTKSMLDDTYARVVAERTVIFIPHRLSTIKSCDQVYLLHGGKIVAAGDHRTLLADSELYRHLQYLEFNEFAGVVAAPAGVGGNGEA